MASFSVRYNRRRWTLAMHRAVAKMPGSPFAHVTYAKAIDFPRRICVTDSKKTWNCECCKKPYSMWYTDDDIWYRLPQDRGLTVIAQHCECPHCEGRLGEVLPLTEMALCVECFRAIITTLEKHGPSDIGTSLW